MSTPPLSLSAYQLRAVTTDRTRAIGNGRDLLVLGLFGETGSLLSEVKKKQRDCVPIGYENAVIEEMGDTLWYLAVIADHAGIALADVAAPTTVREGTDGLGSSPDIFFAQLQPQPSLPLQAPSVAFERTLLQLAGAVGQLAARAAQGDRIQSGGAARHLAFVFEILIDAANEAGVTLEAAALHNLDKAADRWRGK